MTLRLASFCSVCLASPALAHPGHGAAGWLHGLAAEHLGPLALAALAVGVVAARRRVARERSRSH